MKLLSNRGLFAAAVAIVASAAVLSGCDREKASDSASTPNPRERRVHDRGAPPTEELADDSGLAAENAAPGGMDRSKGFGDFSDEDLVNLCTSIITARRLTPESEGAERLEGALTQLIRRDCEELYAVLAMLPPGYYSESIVGKAFMRYPFRSLEELLELAAPILAPDLYQAALNGGAGTILLNGRREGIIPAAGFHELVELKAAGLSSGYFAAFLVAGVASGHVQTAEVVSQITDGDNGILMEAVHRLPHDQVKALFDEAWSSGFSVDFGSLGTFSRSLVRDDPQAAIAWAEGLSGENGPVAIRSAFSEWMAADPLAASEHLGSMSPGKSKDAAILVLIKDCIGNGSYDDAAS